MTTRVSETLARPGRTAIQMTPAAVLTELLDVFVVDLDERGYLAVFAAMTLIFGVVQNALENSGGKGWWLRAVPPETQPVVDDGGEGPLMNPLDRGDKGAYDAQHALILAFAVVGIVLIVLLIAGVL